MMILKQKESLYLYLAMLLQVAASPLFAQPEVTGWGNIAGIRVEGQLLELNSSLVVAGAGWSDITRTAKERQRPQYHREGDQHIISTTLADLFSLSETVEEAGTGKASVDVSVTALKDTSVLGAFFSLRLPVERFRNGMVSVLDPARINLEDASRSTLNEILRIDGAGIRITSEERMVEIRTTSPTQLIVRRTEDEEIEILAAITRGSVRKDQVIMRSFTLSVEGVIDRDPVKLVMDPKTTGRIFDGFGGNFRLQNPDTDPQVIDYCLENMRVAWARVEMPWAFWHMDEETDPLEAARAGQLHQRVRDAMENAQKIHKLGIPVMVAVWSGPRWAIVGRRSFGPQPGGLRGNPLDPGKIQQIYYSITTYIQYMKEAYGVEAEMFSFNESDLGIYIRQTAEEHRDLIKGLGAYLKSRGLKTKLLLGDTADANGWPFLEASLEDDGTLPYIGAVSFHSWRGFETETLQKWADAAVRSGKPLMVGEGSIDAAAWNYPDIFQEQIYIMEEINLYIRILAICQPQTILQWQLTADYSPMAGGGIFGDSSQLRPTQRFWNLKQLSHTPEGLSAVAITSDHPEVNCAALGDPEKNTYAIHIVNNGASREAVVTGLPEKVKKFRVVVTDSMRGMEEQEAVRVESGEAKLSLAPMSYTTLVAGRWQF